MATIATAYVQVMPSMEGATENITDAILPSLTKGGEKAGGLFGDMFTGKLGGAFKKFGAAAAGMLAFDTLKDSFVSVEGGFNNVIKATGATGESAESLKSVYMEVSRSVTGSFEDIGSAIGELNTRLDLNGDALEEAGEAMMKYAKVTGQDATKATQDVASMMNNIGIPADQLETTLDKLTKAGQAAGIDVSSLANNVTKYSATMKTLGFDTDDTIAIMAQFEKSGADTATVLNAMKKGVASWAKEGKDARAEFDAFVKGVEDGSVTAGDAVELFGSKGGLSMYEAAKKGQLSFEGMYKAIVDESGGALDDVYKSTLTMEERMELLGKSLQSGFYEIIEPLVEAIEPYMDDIIDAVAGAVRWIVDVAGPAIKGFVDFVSPLFGFLANDVVPRFGKAIEAIGEIIQIFASAADSAFKDVGNFFTNLGNSISNIGQSIGSTFGAIGNTIKGWGDGVMSVFTTVTGWIQSTFQGALDFLSGIPGQILGFFSGLGSMITDAIGSIHFPLPHVSFENVSVGPMKIPLPHVEWYARGGIVDSPTLIGAGEAGKEAVVPLTQPALTPFAKSVASEMDTGEIVSLLRVIAGKDSNIYLDGKTLVGGIASRMDSTLGTRRAMTARGLA